MRGGMGEIRGDQKYLRGRARKTLNTGGHRGSQGKALSNENGVNRQV
jgi:hypothetical protein